MRIIDDLDSRLINELLNDSTLSLRELAKRLSVSPVTVQNRLRKIIESNIINRFTLSLNFHSLGFNEALLEIKALELSKLLEILNSSNRVISIEYISSEFDLLVRFIYENEDELISFISSMNSYAKSINKKIVLKKYSKGFEI